MVCVQLGGREPGYKSPGCEVKVQQSWVSNRTMNYSAISHTLVGITFCLLLFFVEFSQARPWWNAADYDPSLDPVAWSRSFVQDQVRKTRYNYNVIPDVIRPRSKHRHRQTASQMWYEKPLAPAGKYHKRFFRRRPKLASREKYSRWRP